MRREYRDCASRCQGQTVAVAQRLPTRSQRSNVRLEVDQIERALAEAHYKQTEAAPLLGLGYHQLRALLRKHDMVKSRGRLNAPTVP